MKLLVLCLFKLKIMATITLKGNPVHTLGELPAIGEKIPDVELVKNDLSRVKLSEFFGSKLVLNIFPSLETGICSMSIRTFNQKASELKDTSVLCISRDLPFTQAKFCGAEGLQNVITLSDFATHDLGKKFNLEMTDGLFAGLLSRVVLVLDKEGRVVYKEQVPEIATEPDYQGALNALAAIR
jgi:thioredoxin-dependent peroxiredoxin